MIQDRISYVLAKWLYYIFFLRRRRTER